MITLALYPLAASAAFGLGACWLARTLSGRVATVLLTSVALACALSLGLVLSAIGCLALAQFRTFAVLGHWSPAFVASHDPLPAWLGCGCAAVAAALMLSSCVRLTTSVRQIVRAAALGRALAAEQPDDLVILDHASADAYVLAGAPGRTVITRTMLRVLSGSERRALLAHESSHVKHYHFVYLNLVLLAAAANPLLVPAVRAVHLSIERWADDDAARDVDDRALVATALARAGLARGSQRVPQGALGAVASELAVRLDALCAPRMPSRARGVLVAAALMLAAVGCVLTSATLGLQLHNLIEWAQAIDARAHRS